MGGIKYLNIHTLYKYKYSGLRRNIKGGTRSDPGCWGEEIFKAESKRGVRGILQYKI